MKLQLKVQNYIEKNKLLTSKGLVIVGVSGGADSVVLLHLLLKLGYNCAVAHCNFHLRANESEMDELFVRKIASELSIPYFSIDFETKKYAKENGISIEMAARDLRYDWFNKLLLENNAQAIAIAHHADDSIETLLMNLVRGTGLRGLTGIAAKNEKVIRPLLCSNRKEIEDYIVEFELKHITDSSNISLEYQRNKFRNQIIPLLEEINPSVRQVLYESISRFNGTLAIYEQAIERIKADIVHEDSEIIKLDIDLIKKQVDIPTIMYELLQVYGFGASTICQVTDQLDSESGKQFFSTSHRLIKDRKHLIINKIIDKYLGEIYVEESETEIFDPIHLKITRLNNSPDFIVSKSKDCIHLDAKKIVFPLKIRKWMEADIFYPFGMNKKKKISDYFIDNKFSILEKENTWFLVSGDDIVWIIGQRTDNRYRIDADTEEIIEIRLV